MEKLTVKLAVAFPLGDGTPDTELGAILGTTVAEGETGVVAAGVGATLPEAGAGDAEAAAEEELLA